MKRHKVRFLLEDNDPVDLIAVGRDGWALSQLLNAGETGLTTLQNPAPRWSHYVYKLRRMGVNIATINEKHGGPYSGTHARYILQSKIRVLDTERPTVKEAANEQ